jgi:hypothetical protein
MSRTPVLLRIAPVITAGQRKQLADGVVVSKDIHKNAPRTVMLACSH